MADSDNQSGLWLYVLIQSLMGGIGFITLVFFMTFVAFSLAYSWRLISQHKHGDDTTFRIIGRYASTLMFKIHAAAYIAGMIVFVAVFLFKQLG